jgi:hypothetical protein
LHQQIALKASALLHENLFTGSTNLCCCCNSCCCCRRGGVAPLQYTNPLSIDRENSNLVLTVFRCCCCCFCCCCCRRGRIAPVQRNNPLSIDPSEADAMLLGSSYSLSHPSSSSRQDGGGGSGWFGWLTKSDSRDRAAGRDGGLSEMRSVESKPRNEHEEVQVGIQRVCRGSSSSRLTSPYATPIGANCLLVSILLSRLR